MISSRSPGDQATKITRTIYMLSFLGDVQIGLFSFAVSLYTTIMASALGFSPVESAFWLSIVATGWGAVYWFAPIILGHLSDKIGRKFALLMGMAIFIVVNVLVLVAAWHPFHLFLAFAASAACFAFYYPVLGALSSEISECQGSTCHSQVVSRFMVSWSIGLMLGPLIGGTFDTLFNHVIAFWFLAGISILISVIVMACLPSKPELVMLVHAVNQNHLDNHQHESGASTNPPKKSVTFSRPFLRVMLFSMPFIFSFMNQIYFAVFPGFAVDNMILGVFDGADPSFMAGMLVFSLGFGRTVTFFHAGKMGKWLRLPLVILSPLVMGVATMIVYFFPLAGVLLVAFPVYGIFSGYTFSTGLLTLMESSRSGKGLKAGFYEAAVGIGTLLSTFVSIFISPSNPSNPFLLSSITGLVTSGAMFLAYLSWQKGPPSLVEKYPDESGR
ncbi:MFS transporter [Candidatus Bathyarchaeota archaeon]|nr:MFS transporter [Candidatus Bathyarchaeota archaeon]